MLLISNFSSPAPALALTSCNSRGHYFDESTLPSPALVFTDSIPLPSDPAARPASLTAPSSTLRASPLPTPTTRLSTPSTPLPSQDAVAADSGENAHPEKVLEASRQTLPDSNLLTNDSGVSKSQQYAIDNASSPSSTAAHHSTNTSRADAASPATSPDDEAPPTQGIATGVSASTSTVQMSGRVAEASKTRGTRPSVNFASELQARPSQPLSPSSSRAATHDDDASAADTKTRPEPTQVLTPASSAAPDEVRRDSHHDKMDLDQVDESSQQRKRRPLSSRPVLEPINSSQAQAKKIKRRDANLKMSLVVGKLDRTTLKPTQEGRSWPDPAHAGPMKMKDPRDDYMYLLFHKEALDKAYKRDLSALLAHSPKTLTTAEWLAGHREKQDCNIIKRVYDLQQKGLWSLRQKKPEPEPKLPLTHQDYLLRHVKWLQTDFREERKLKVDVLYQLASWCAEYVNASPEERSALRVNSTKTPTLQDQPQSLGKRQLEDISAEPVLSDALLDCLPLCGLDDSTLRSSKRLKIRNSQEGSKSFIEHSLTAPKLPTDYDMDPDTVLDDDIAPAVEIPPEDTTCALFHPEHRQLRARVNVQWPFKPPTGPDASMPPQAFFENRQASQWTHEDDQQLRGYVKDFPSNWHLIADRMAPRTKFPSTRDRRTPWECYERLLSMEVQPTDMNTRQMVRQFQHRMEQARARYTNSHAASVQQAQQAAQQAGQSTSTVQGPRFPSPIRVERRASNRRFLGLLDGARKLARRRENAATKQQQQQAAHDAAAQVPKPARTHPPHTPAHMSKLKFEQQQSNLRRQEEQKARLRALQVQQQQARQSGNQALYNGIAQRMGSMPNGTTTANGHLAVPGQGQGRAMPQQAGQMNIPNGARPNSQLAAQLAANGRPPANLSNQQRLAPQANGSVGTADQQNMQQILQQQRSLQQFQQQQAAQQHRASPGIINGMSNQNVNGTFNGHLSSGGDASQSPNLGPAMPDGQHQASPNMSQQMMASGAGQHRRTPSQPQPQQLSSGHVPAIYNLQHQIAMNNPQLSQEQVNLRAQQQLKHMMHQSRQNALNAASGVSSQLAVQTPMHPPASNNTQYPQNVGQQNYNQNGMLSSNHAQGRSASPANPTAQQQHQNYQQQLRQQMYNQSRIAGSNGMNNAASPAMSTANVNGMGFNGNIPRTSTPVSAGVTQAQGMRPPSQNAGSMGMQPLNGSPFDQQQQQQRQGSAQIGTPRLATQSPRPLSSQGQQS